MKKILVIVTVVLTLLCSTLLASAASDSAVTIVNPTHQSGLYSDSLLISIKVTQPKTVRVQVFEQMQVVSGTAVSVDVNALIKKSKEASTGGAVIANTSSAGIAAIADLKNVAVCDAEKFTCTNELTMVTKQVKDLKPALYLVQVDTLDSSGKVLFTSQGQVAVLGKQTQEQGKIFDTPQNGTLQFLQDLLKNLFQ